MSMSLFLVSFFCLYPTNAFGTSGSWSSLKLSPDLQFEITAYDTMVRADSWLYCDSFGWDNADNSTAFELSNTFIGSGLAVADLSVSVENANLTFNSLGQSGCSFDLEQSGVNDANIELVGFLEEPAEVIADGVLLDNYTYTSASDSLIIQSSASMIELTFFYGDDLSEVAIAVGFLAFIFGVVALALVIVKRRNNEND